MGSLFLNDEVLCNYILETTSTEEVIPLSYYDKVSDYEEL